MRRDNLMLVDDQAIQTSVHPTASQRVAALGDSCEADRKMQQQPRPDNWAIVMHQASLQRG